MSDPRFSIIPADADQYDESWKLELLATRPDTIDELPSDEIDDGSALAALMEASGGRCWYCGCKMTFGGAGIGASITREHMLPRARGGSNKPSNIVAACRACNVSKQAKTVEEFRTFRGVVEFYGEAAR
jgi:5-methylcytosine-specific restriction endonuclease McrA